MTKKNILLDLRIDKDELYNEIREQIDINWLIKLQKNNYNPLILSSYSFNSLKELEKFCLNNKIKILAVCRGAQALLKFYRIKLIKTKFQIKKKIPIKLIKKIKGLPKNSYVTCYHKYGVYSIDLKNSFENLYQTYDKTSEVFYNEKRKQIGMMWHPERENKDQLFKKIVRLIN